MSTIILKDHTRDERVTLEFSQVKKVSILSLTSAQVEDTNGEVNTFDFGMDGIRRLKEWVLRESAAEPNKTCPTYTVVTNSDGRAALEDLISHGPNLLDAIDHRIELATAQDADPARDDTDPPQTRDANESYWKRERTVIERMIRQAHFALGRTPE